MECVDMMPLKTGHRVYGAKPGRPLGFTIVEVMFASTILAFVFAGTIMLLQYRRIQAQKSLEHSMMLDFAQHYLETARQQSFSNIIAGFPINALYDGAHGAPDIRFPSDTTWQSLLTEDYKNYHPDLEWFNSRDPQYRCVITNQMANHPLTGVQYIRSKHLFLQLRWRPPLEKGSEWLTMDLSSVVYRDFN